MTETEIGVKAGGNHNQSQLGFQRGSKVIFPQQHPDQHAQDSADNPLS